MLQIKKPLIDVIFASEKRKQVLWLLKDGAKEMETLLKSLDTTRIALLPQTRILEEHYLVSHDNDIYELITIGKLVVDDMAPILNIVETFDTDIDYWGTHNLDFIPAHLLKRMNVFENCQIINPPITDQFDIKCIYNEKSKESDFLYTITAMLYPNYHVVFSDLIENNLKIDLIVSEDLLKKIRTDYHADFENYMKTGLINIYAYNKKIDFLFFTFTEDNLLIRLLKNNGDIDGKLLLFNINAKTLEWAEELFNYYLKDSIPVTEL